MKILRYIAISFMSGITAIIPGVSGGTIFAIFGISEHLAEDINGLVESLFGFSQGLKHIFRGILKYGQLPIIIGLGSLVSSLFYAKLLVNSGPSIEFFLRFLFIGLVIFSIPTLWAETKVEEKHKDNLFVKLIYVAIGFIISVILFNSNQALIQTGTPDYSSVSYLIEFFIISLIAGITTILPGISGTNIMILGGIFEDYIHFSSEIGNYPIQYAVYLLATIIGAVIAAKFFTLLFKYFRRGFFSIMTGLTASTILFIWANPFSSVMHFTTAIIGFAVAYLLISTLNEQEQKAKHKS